MGLRLALGGVTVLLGPDGARRAVMAALDDTTGRCATGHGSVPVERLTAAAEQDVAERLAALETAGRGPASIVLVERVTDGLAAAERRAVLDAVRGMAAPGRAVLVDDTDPVAALSVADGALRADPSGGVRAEPVADLDFLAS
ncbi:hypothetical protein [Geodermatophilus marinus]|uniref:hypothetical protein n=1 Tax=Geodermatophilus sp. LHW52908 TaxID=2303986 RepID=UPI000E3C57C5|nr:hypothetical protein [Geodermatophilus sp. LHW52908]RFU22237.1 hypothetical protein D0Z06_06105 [Geodermatophilus sp. LHW52908]